MDAYAQVVLFLHELVIPIYKRSNSMQEKDCIVTSTAFLKDAFPLDVQDVPGILIGSSYELPRSLRVVGPS